MGAMNIDGPKVEVQVEAPSVEVEVEAPSVEVDKVEIQVETPSADISVEVGPADVEKHQEEALSELDQTFRNLDKDNNGKLDPDEFAKYLADQYGFSQDEAKEVFEKWDLNRDGGITCDEFKNMMGELAAVQRAIIQKYNDKDAAMVKGAVAAGGSCFIIAVCCCVCTLGISMLIFLCCFGDKLDAAADSMENMERAKKEELFKDVKKKLLKGP